MRLLVLSILLLAGCAEAPLPATEPIVEAPTIFGQPSNYTVSTDQVLTDLSAGQLKQKAAQLVIPAGSYAVTRFFEHANMHEGTPSSGSLDYRLIWEGPEDTRRAILRAGGMGDDTFKPWLGQSYLVSRNFVCGGCTSFDGGHTIVAIGSPTEDVRLWLGVGETTVERLKARDTIAIRPDVFATTILSGTAQRTMSGANELLQDGGDWDVIRDRTGGAAADGIRTMQASMTLTANRTGTLGVSLAAEEWLGVEEWSIVVAAGGAGGRSLHAASWGDVTDLSGATQAPDHHAILTLPPGTHGLEIERAFRGISGGDAVLADTDEEAMFAFVDVDLLGRYGLEV